MNYNDKYNTIAAMAFRPLRLFALSAFAICLSASFANTLSAETVLERIAREAREESARPPLPVLTQEDIDLIVVAAPKLQRVLEMVAPPELSKEQQDQMTDFVFDGRPNTGTSTVLSENGAMLVLDQEAKGSGFLDFQNFANKADAVYAVFFAEFWVLSSRDAVFGDQPKPEPIENLGAYLKDPSSPEEEKEKLQGQLTELLEKYGTSSGNADLVFANYETLKNAVWDSYN